MINMLNTLSAERLFIWWDTYNKVMKSTVLCPYCRWPHSSVQMGKYFACDCCGHVLRS